MGTSRNVWRTSSYVIYVDIPGDDESVLIIHGYNGTYDKVSRAVATYLRSLEVNPSKGSCAGPFPGGEPREELVVTLRQRGYLTTLTIEEEEKLFVRIVSLLHERSLRAPPSYILMPTYACNLRCPYCFQAYLRDGEGERQILKIIEPHMVDQIFFAMSKLEEMLSPGPRSKRQITLFGGEPLLAASRSAIEYILNKAATLGDFTFRAITNATDLACYRDLLGPEGISSLQVTLDGSASEHDKRRIYPDGRGSFHLIADNITMALEAGARVAVRINVDRTNVGDLPRLADEIVARGWHEHSIFVAYISPIRAQNEKSTKITTFGLWELSRNLKMLKKDHVNMSVISTVDNSMRRQAKRIFSQTALRSKMKPSFCGAHSNMLVFDAYGDIYTCWERTGGADFRVGRVEDDGRLRMSSERLETWRSRTVASNPICRKCRYALHCGGGCAILAAEKCGDFFNNSCDGFASRFRLSVAEAYLEAQRPDGDERLHHETCGV